MRINLNDPIQHSWYRKTKFFLLLALLVFIAYALVWFKVSGATPLGIAYGIVGYLLMFYVALLSIRKKAPKLAYQVIPKLRNRFPALKAPERWSREMVPVRDWMQRHLWLGILSYPLILFHSGFKFGNGLTCLMMWIFSIVIVTGIGGALLQHYMPRIMTERLEQETIYGDIAHVRELLKNRAKAIFDRFKGDSLYGLPPQPAAKIPTHRTATRIVRIDPVAGKTLREAYEGAIRSYLAKGYFFHHLHNRQTSKKLFTKLRANMPELVLPVVDDLEKICAEKRDLDRQSLLHFVLHGWLVIHVPLSAALLVLGLFHGVKALFYD